LDARAGAMVGAFYGLNARPAISRGAVARALGIETNSGPCRGKAWRRDGDGRNEGTSREL